MAALLRPARLGVTDALALLGLLSMATPLLHRLPVHSETLLRRHATISRSRTVVG
ncbi:hypothetical protein [Dactylosporangium sp. CA-233914]|uniref:hypothetical protein n=1 Tax=Dactylosporangium sp. CA-233914 TaxID=3239934 RepID=UPI003D90D986